MCPGFCVLRSGPAAKVPARPGRPAAASVAGGECGGRRLCAMPRDQGGQVKGRKTPKECQGSPRATQIDKLKSAGWRHDGLTGVSGRPSATACCGHAKLPCGLGRCAVWLSCRMDLDAVRWDGGRYSMGAQRSESPLPRDAGPTRIDSQRHAARGGDAPLGPGLGSAAASAPVAVARSGPPMLSVSESLSRNREGAGLGAAKGKGSPAFPKGASRAALSCWPDANSSRVNLYDLDFCSLEGARNSGMGC